jgi:PKD domain-containing protein
MRMLGALAAVFALVVGSAQALNAPAPPRHGGDSLLAAKEESGLQGIPDAAVETPAGKLRILNPELVAATFGQAIRFELTVARDVSQGSVSVTIPERWRTRAASGLVGSRVPRARRSASGVRLQTGGGAATLQLDGAKAGAQPVFEIVDTGIPAGTYELPVSWTDAHGTRSLGRLELRLYAPAREGIAPVADSASDGRAPFNVSNDSVFESETFVTAVPNNPSRILVGANGGSPDPYNAWVSTNGGTSFTRQAVPASMDVPGSAAPQLGDLCCDPFSMADDQGNIWYGGLTLEDINGPSRITVSRVAAGTDTFVNTVGLPVRTDGTQDKPMGAIDMDPSSPRYGRLYVVWDEPAAAGVNVVLSLCDTRPAGVLDPAHCDNADNWTTPVSVTKTSGSYIYPEVAAAPDGKVYVIWWNYSSANAIQGATCAAPATSCNTAPGWSIASNIATLNATGGAPVPFACPTLGQPGGRVGPATAMDVDRTSGPSRGTVYVTWSDLRTGSGTTRCQVGNVPPRATDLTWDSFVATASGVLPSGGASSAVGTRIITDGEGGGQANSDDWFPSVAVDQSTGRAYVDVYSTRDDATRQTMHVYARQVSSSEQIGALTKVSTAASDYSDSDCCNFGNDYGDYNGIDAAGGFAFVVWSDKSDADGDVFFDKVQPASPSVAQPAITFGPWSLTEAAPADGDGVFEAGEDVTLSAPLGNTGSATATSTQGILITTSPYALVLEGTKVYGNIPAEGNATPASPYRIRLLSTLPCGQQQVPLHLQVSYTGGTTSRDEVLTTNTTCPTTPPPPPAPNASPAAVITGPNTASAGRVNFDASRSADSDGTIAKFQWDADGNAGNGFEVDTGTTPRLAAALAAGSRTVSVRVTDNGGATAQASKALRVVPAAAVRLVGSGSSIKVRSGRFRLVVAGCAACRGRLTVMAATKGRATGKQLVGTARFTIGPNGRANVAVTLTSNGRRLLRRLNRIRSTVSLTVTNAAGQTRTAGGRITLRR